MTYILRPERSGAAGELGGKARALASLRRARLPIPAWFVLTPSAFFASLTSRQRSAIESGYVVAAVEAIKGEIHLSHEVESALAKALASLCPMGEPVAVRSSASDEDGAEHSFAGQLDSFLFVPGNAAAVAERVVEVWRSAFHPRVLAYREQHGLPPMPHPPSVLIQRMVSADRSGVAFGADPVSGRRGIAVVAAVWGLGTALVSGESDADTYHVDRERAICLRQVANKKIAYRAAPENPEGIEKVSVPDSEADRPVLNDAQVRAIADLVRQTSRHSGYPCDIEWAIEAGELYLLQSRPITALGSLPDPDGVLNLWDNSNIAESYNGVTTPLTFSFARRAYTAVYWQLCHTLRVSPEVLEANDEVFRHMLGLIRGRVYYNLLNWYRVLVLLPGFTVNRRFMEQMMGVREGLPDELVREISRAGSGARLRDGMRLAGTLAGMLGSYRRLPRQIKAFHAELNHMLATPDPPLEELRADELAALYRQMEQKLLTHWDPPLINDLFTMIFYGLLGRLTTRWCHDTDGTIRNSLVRGEGGMISAEPALRIREMAEAVQGDEEMIALLRMGSLETILDAMEQRSALRTQYHTYLSRFGDRCMEELKLESSTLQDDPLPLLRSIGRLANSSKQVMGDREEGRDSKEQTNGTKAEGHLASTTSAENPSASKAPEESSKQAGPLRSKDAEASAVKDAAMKEAEKRMSRALRGHPVRRLVLGWVLRNARDRIRDRENLRFERTRLFGRVRRIFVEIGKRFHAEGLLTAPRDIFYLEVEEILGIITGTSTCVDLKGLTALRQAEFARYRQEEPPDGRFETRGIVYTGNTFRDARPPEASATPGDAETLTGIGCCPGIVRARARVIRDPRGAALTPGSILVAERTDPGWVLLFPAAAGLLVERGSLLSHSAIVAREMGIPAIVAIPELTRRIKDGDLVEMDGSTGMVRRIGVKPADENEERSANGNLRMPSELEVTAETGGNKHEGQSSPSEGAHPLTAGTEGGKSKEHAE